MGKMDKLFDGADHDYYPAWVCSSCGAKYGRRRCGTACWHVGTCGICGIEASVTEPRDFGHLQTDWRERYEQEASNAEIRGAGTASAGLPGYAGDNNGD